MTKAQKISLLLLRLSLGSLFFYGGIIKIMDPNWSAAAYLRGAKTFASFYLWLMQPGILPVVNFLNEWGLTLLGWALILGIFVRLAAYAGVPLMLLYYFSQSTMRFPFPSAGSFIFDQRIIFSLALILLANFEAGRYWGLEDWCRNLPICSRFPKLRDWL